LRHQRSQSFIDQLIQENQKQTQDKGLATVMAVSKLLANKRKRQEETPEQKAERLQKKQKREVDLQKRKEDKERKQIEEKDAAWKEAGYLTLSIQLDTSMDWKDEMDDDLLIKEDEDSRAELHYVTGDASKPILTLSLQEQEESKKYRRSPSDTTSLSRTSSFLRSQSEKKIKQKNNKNSEMKRSSSLTKLEVKDNEEEKLNPLSNDSQLERDYTASQMAASEWSIGDEFEDSQDVSNSLDLKEDDAIMGDEGERKRRRGKEIFNETFLFCTSTRDRWLYYFKFLR